MINLKTKDWEIKNIDTILFDKDGTFIDLHFFWGKMTELRVNEIIKHFNLNHSLFNELCLLLGYNPEKSKMIPDGITALYSRKKIIEIFQNEIKRYNIETTSSKIEEIFDKVSLQFYKDIEKYTKPIESAIDFIKKVKNKGVKVGIITSDSIESTLLTLKLFHWEKIFEVVIGRESSPHTKESGEPTKIALKKLKADYSKTIMIGDAPMDYISAKNAGIEKTILVATGQIIKSDLKKTSEYTVNDLSEIFID